MKKFLLFITSLIICVSSVAAQQVSPPARNAAAQNVPLAARNIYERAMVLSKAGKVQLALVMMQEALKLYPDYFDAHLALGNEMAKANRFNDAIIEFEKARRINPGDDQVYLSVGLVMMQQKRYDTAATIFADAIALNPNEPFHHLLRGIALIRQALAINPSSSNSSPAESDRLYNKAEEELAEAANLSGNRLSQVYLYRAMIYEKRGAKERAADELEQYLTAEPNADNADAVRDAIRRLRGQAASR